MLTAPELDTIRSRLLDEDSGVIRHGHFVFDQFTPKEMHGRVYVDPRAIFRNYALAWQVLQALAELIPTDIKDRTDIVAGPTTGGAVLAQLLSGLFAATRNIGAASLGTVFLDKATGFRVSDYDLNDSDRKFIADRNVLLVDDVRHKGDTLIECSGQITGAGGRVLATATIVDRGMSKLPIPGARHFSLVQLEPDELFRKLDCPMCRAGQRRTKL